MQTQAPVGQIRLASGLNVLAGLWEIIAPFVLGYSGDAVATTNDVVVGIVVAIFAAIRFLGAYGAAWLSWVNAVLGVWLIVAPFILGYSGIAAATTNDIILGIIIAALGVWGALATRGGALR